MKVILCSIWKGIIHHVVGDHDGGNQALNAATRSTVVIGTGVAAGIASGGRNNSVNFVFTKIFAFRFGSNPCRNSQWSGL